MLSSTSAFAGFSQQDIAQLESLGKLEIDLPSGKVLVMEGDYEISSEDMPGWLVATEGKLTIALDITVNEALRREGTARELVNRIQNLRKDCGFEVTDKVSVVVEAIPEIEDSMKDFKEYIASQTLCSSIVAGNADGGREVEWNDGTLKIRIEKA